MHTYMYAYNKHLSIYIKIVKNKKDKIIFEEICFKAKKKYKYVKYK